MAWTVDGYDGNARCEDCVGDRGRTVAFDDRTVDSFFNYAFHHGFAGLIYAWYETNLPVSAAVGVMVESIKMISPRLEREVEHNDDSEFWFRFHSHVLYHTFRLGHKNLADKV